ncbi:flagellar basal body P-ring formation chaperone FlgA [uncultured Sphingomonas sp.]|uniref:flagellar basal body P-ring formation chaperone FlgA n=1 Tax=uncultured Sphingomonas sp. TaxID=158754 RepID=UPI0035CA18D5
MIALLALLLAADAPATTTVEVAVLTRAVERGETLAVSDFERSPRAPGLAIGAVVATRAAGRELVRALPAGAVVRASDTITPRLVRRGEPVAINLRARGLLIATGGRALTAGGMGDLVRVVATATNRTFDAVVEGSGAVRLGTP